MMNEKEIAKWSVYLLIIGGLNWGLSLFDINLVSYLPGAMLQNIVYGAVGLSAVYLLWTSMK